MAGPEFVEILVGAGAARIRDLFMRAKVTLCSYLAIDDPMFFRIFLDSN